MARILLIETATKTCSVGICEGDRLIAHCEITEDKFVHAEQLHVLIKEVLDELKISGRDLDAIAVGKGPGSYTGLRIGVATAKGLCYAWDLPLISVSTLRVLARGGQLRAEKNDAVFVPMLDARRDEVYTQLYDDQLQPSTSIRADILDKNYFTNQLGDSIIYVFGDGAGKCKDLVDDSRMKIIEGVVPSVGQMVGFANEKYSREEFEDTAYFEPFYLKEFIADPPRKML